mgnify:CR=1 FL=1
MSLGDLKKELKKLNKAEIIEVVADLYKKNKSVRDFFDFYVTPDEGALYDKYHDKIFEAFFPKRGFNYSLKAGKQAIAEFKKLGGSPTLVAELMLFYVETGVEFTNAYGDINEAFYSSLKTTFKNSLTLMQKENILETFEIRVDKIIKNTSDIGWGFHESLVETWIDFYPIKDDETQE